MRWLGLAMVAAAILTASHAQNQTTRLEFEVASIKATPPGSMEKSMGSFGNGAIRWQGHSIKEYVQTAYNVKDYAYSGPVWMDTALFDVVAKIPARNQFPQYREMMQTLLADRFKLTVHRESRTVNAHLLVVDKSGLKIQAVAPGPGTSSSWGQTKVSSKNASMADFAEVLSAHLDRPVKDETGVAGRFDIKVEWLGEDAPLVAGGPSATTIFGALQDQIGLRLQTGKMTVEVVVVDHCEKLPIEN